MTICINVHNVNQGLAEGLRHMQYAKLRPTRNGPALVVNQPVITEYASPTDRVLFSPLRDANPFFHLMEALWMLAGRNDVAFVAQFAKQMLQYSDDGVEMWGAYGERWRKTISCGDQLVKIAEMLRANPDTRQAVLGMWHYPLDLGKVTKDLPCNTHAYFDAADGKLNMSVLCRSNDIWWGCYGANAVHFSVLLEFMAGACDLEVGVYRQFSNNFHMYMSVIDAKPEMAYRGWLDRRAEDARYHDLYTFEESVKQPRLRATNALKKVPLFGNPHWDGAAKMGYFYQDLERFFSDAWTVSKLYHNRFFPDVALPMRHAHAHYKGKFYGSAEEIVTEIQAGDWAIACMEWLDRRKARRLAKATTEN